MKRPSYECHHKWRRHNNEIDYCPKCKTFQLSVFREVEVVLKQKEHLAPNKVVTFLHRDPMLDQPN